LSLTFTKLFNSITESTIWVEPYPTRIVWVSMLAMADRKGRIWASVPGLARRAGVTLEECEKALERFQAPDKYSRTPDNEGRRIEPIDGGWKLLNYDKYRTLRDEEARREYQREWDRENRPHPRKSDSSDKSRPAPTKAEAEAEAEAEADNPPPKEQHGSAMSIAAPEPRIAALSALCIRYRISAAGHKALMHLRQWAAEGVTDEQFTDAILIARDRVPEPHSLGVSYLPNIVAELRAGKIRARPKSQEEVIAATIANLAAKESTGASH
jgi:hypothetical protein